MTPKPVEEEFCPWVDITVEELEREVAQYANDRKLSPEEIGKLAQRMVDATDPKEKEELTEALFRGWYGGVKDA